MSSSTLLPPKNQPLLVNIFGHALKPSQLGLVVGSALFWELSSRVGAGLALRALDHAPASAKYEKLDKIAKRDLGISAAGALHAVVASIAATWIALTPEPSISGWRLKALYGYSNRSQTLFGVSTGYFLWDLCTVLFEDGQFSVSFLIHAITCIFAYWFAQKPFVHYWGVYYLLFELSTPFLHARKAMLALDMKSWPSFAKIERLFGLTFIFARVVVGVPVSIMFWRHMYALWKKNDGALVHNRFVLSYYLVANLAISGLNYYWTFLILQGFMRRSKRKGDDKEPDSKAEVTDAKSE